MGNKWAFMQSKLFLLQANFQAAARLMRKPEPRTSLAMRKRYMANT